MGLFIISVKGAASNYDVMSPQTVLTAAPMTLTMRGVRPGQGTTVNVTGLEAGASGSGQGWEVRVSQSNQEGTFAVVAAAATTVNSLTVVPPQLTLYVAGVERTSTDRSAYGQGTGRVNNTTNRAPASVNEFRLHRSAVTGNAVYETSGWNTVLLDKEIQALALGHVQPYEIRPAALQACFLLQNGNLRDEVSGNRLIPSGGNYWMSPTTFLGAYRPILTRLREQWWLTPVAAAGYNPGTSGFAAVAEQAGVTGMTGRWDV